MSSPQAAASTSSGHTPDLFRPRRPRFSLARPTTPPSEPASRPLIFLSFRSLFFYCLADRIQSPSHSLPLFLFYIASLCLFFFVLWPLPYLSLFFLPSSSSTSSSPLCGILSSSFSSTPHLPGLSPVSPSSASFPLPGPILTDTPSDPYILNPAIHPVQLRPGIMDQQELDRVSGFLFPFIFLL